MAQMQRPLGPSRNDTKPGIELFSGNYFAACAAGGVIGEDWGNPLSSHLPLPVELLFSLPGHHFIEWMMFPTLLRFQISK